MAVSYKKLWKLLIDKEMMKKDLRAMTGVSTTTMSRLSKDENVSWSPTSSDGRLVVRRVREAL